MEPGKIELVVFFILLFVLTTSLIAQELTASGEGTIEIIGSGNLMLYGEGNLNIFISKNVSNIEYTTMDGSEREITVSDMEGGFEVSGTIHITAEHFDLKFSGKCINMDYTGDGNLVFKGTGYYDYKGSNYQWSDDGVFVNTSQ